MRRTSILIGFILLNTILVAQQLAFPTAEGYGKYTLGGRGGKIIEVTNLNDAGTGSLRAAVEASGARTVVFRVSGTITLNSAIQIKNPYITIAGQTAPGDGICLRKYPLIISADHVIIRYIRVRFGNETTNDADAVSCRFTKNLIVDHVSASWSVDEVMSIYHSENITVQWCVIAESMYNAGHVKGAHGFGGIWGATYGTYHHNLIAHNSSRNIRFASGSVYTDFRNNVIYNWGYNSSYGGENQQVGDANYSSTHINMVANYYKPGPATQPGEISYRIVSPDYRDVKTDYGKWYIADNVMIGNTKITSNNWDGGVQPKGGSGDLSLIKQSSPWAAMAIKQQTAEEAYKLVLDNAGTVFPKRDAVDAHVVNDARNGTATYEGATYEGDHTVKDKSKKCGIIDNQNDVGGWPVLNSTTAPTDTDHDGMPDDWERNRKLDPNKADNNGDDDNDGYTNIEEYLACLVGEGNCPSSTPAFPVVTITAPSIGSSALTTATINFTANATDSDGTIAKVEFFADGASLGAATASGSAFVLSKTGLGTGSHTVIAKATDNSGNVTTSAAITINILQQQSINLTTGWNLLSINLRPTDSSIITLFSGIDIEEVKTMEAFWRKGQVANLNSLQSVTPGQGYLVKANSAGTLTIVGLPISSASAVLNQSGWQLMGCPYAAATAFTQIFTSSNCLFVKDFNGFWTPNGSANSIKNCEPGKGYFIQLSK